MKLSLALLVGVALACSQGCGGKSDAEKFADSYCAEIAKCCVQAGLPGDGKSCHAEEAYNAAGSGYDSQAGDACLAEVRSQVSAGTFCTDLGPSSKASCGSVYGYVSPGSQNLGEFCSLDSDCAPASTAEVGCSGGTQTCAALLAVGATCRFSSDCVRSAFCDYSKTTCTARVAAGDVCTGSNSEDCVDGYYCSSTSNQCTAQVASGTACTTDVMCKSDNCNGVTCEDNNYLWLTHRCTEGLNATP